MSGTGDVMKGKAKEAVGVLTGDKGLEREGKADQATGNAKKRLRRARNWIDDKVNKITRH